MNLVVLLGTIMDNPVIREFDSGKKGTFITLKVQKPFRSYDGNIEYDYIKCSLWEGIAQSTCDYCAKGDVIGVRGRLNTYTDEFKYSDQNGIDTVKKISTLQFVVERVSFVSVSKKNKVNNETSEPYLDLVEES